MGGGDFCCRIRTKDRQVLLEAEDDMEDPDPLARFGPMRCALSSPSFCTGEMRRDEEKEWDGLAT